MRSSQSRRRSLKLHEFASRRSRSITRREGTNSTGIHTQQQQQQQQQHQPQQPPPPITNSRESSPADIDLLSLDSCSQGGPPPLSLASSISYTTGSGSNGSSAFTSLSTTTTHNNHHKQPKDDSDLPYLDNDDPDQDDDHDVPFDCFQPHQQRNRDDRGGTGGGGGGGIGYNQHNRQRERPHSANSIATFLSTVSSHTVEATQMMKEHFTLCGAKENNNNNRKGGGGDETAFPTIGSTTSNSTAATTVSNTGHGNSNTNSRLESFFNGHAATAPKHMNNTRAAEDAITDAGSGEPHTAASLSAYYSQCTQSSAERLHMDELYLSDGDDNFSGSTNTIKTSKSEKTVAIHRPLPINTSNVVSTSSTSSTTTTTTTTTRECKQDPTKDLTNSSEGVGASLPASKTELPKYQNLFPDSQQLKRSASTPTVLQSKAGSAFGRVSSTISDKSNLRSSTMYKSAFAPVGSSSGSSSGGGGGGGGGSSGSSTKLGRALYRNESLTNPTRVKGQQSHGGGINEDTVSIVSRDEESVVSRDLSTSGMSARALKKIKNRRRKRRDQRPHLKEEGAGMGMGIGIGIGGEEQFQEESSATHIRSIGDRDTDTVGVDGLRNSLDQLQDEDVNSTKEISVGELAPPPPACDSEDVIATKAGDKSTEMDTFQKLDVDVQANISLLSIVSGNVDESEDANTKSQSLSDLEFGSNSNSRLIESPSPSAYQKISDEEHSHGPSPIVGSRSSSRRSRYRNIVSPVSPYSRAVTPQPELVLPQQKMMQENMSPCSQDSCSNSRITTQSNNTCNQTLCTSYSGTLSCNRSVTSSVAEADREVRETIRRQRKKRDGADLDGSQSVHSSDTNNSNPRAYFSLSSSPAPLRDGANMPVDKFFSRNGAMISPANTKPPSFSTIPSSNLSSNIEEPSLSVDSGSLKPTTMNRLNGIPPRSDNTEKEGRNWRDSDSNSKLSYDGKTSISSKTSSSGSSSSRSRKKDKTRKYQKIRSSKHSDRTPTSTPSPCNSIPVSPAQNSQGMPLSPPNQFNYIHEPTDLQKLGAAKPQVLPRGKMILFPPMGSSSRHRISPYHSVVEDEGRPSTTSTTTQRHFSHVQDGLSLFSRTHESNISQAASAQYKKKLNEQVSAVVTPEKLDHDNLH